MYSVEGKSSPEMPESRQSKLGGDVRFGLIALPVSIYPTQHYLILTNHNVLWSNTRREPAHVCTLLLKS